jgi:hypothetical protein
MKKINPEDVASELRLLSKNWCLSPEVINIISHGYARICELERERDEARRIAAYQYSKHSNYGDESFAMKNFFQFHKWEHLKEDGK